MKKTGKHKSRAPTNNQILNVTVTHAKLDHDFKLKAAELQLTVAIICHCAIRAVDHLKEITKLHSGKDSVFFKSSITLNKMHSSSKECHFSISKRRSDYRLEKPKVFNYS